MNISDEAVEAAARVSYNHRTGRSWDDASRHVQLIECSWTRSALEAAAPHLMAQAWEEGRIDGHAEEQSGFENAMNPYGSAGSGE